MQDINYSAKPRSGLISITVGATHGKLNAAAYTTLKGLNITLAYPLQIQPFQGCDNIQVILSVGFTHGY